MRLGGNVEIENLKNGYSKKIRKIDLKQIVGLGIRLIIKQPSLFKEVFIFKINVVINVSQVLLNSRFSHS